MSGDTAELGSEITSGPLYNKDIAPTPIESRTWSKWHIAALWVGMAVCIPTYMLGAGLLQAGMSWWQAVVTITLGNLIVLVPMALNGHAGTKYGIPFPVFLRASFGTIGSNIPALMRAAVACGWFGIQTWIGGKACYLLAAVLAPSITQAPPIGFLGINGWQLTFFFLFWGLNVYFIVKGTESIKWLETLSAPILIAVGLGLLIWGVSEAGGLGRALDHSSNFVTPTVSATVQSDVVDLKLSPVRIDGKPRATEVRYAFTKDELAKASWTALADARITKPRQATHVHVEFRDAQGRTATKVQSIASASGGGLGFLAIFLPILTAMVGYWATLALNIPDFTRYARSQRDQVCGQLMGLPTTMGLYAFIGIVVTCSTLVAFPDILVTEQAPWDPVVLMTRFSNPLLVIGSMFFLVIATLTTNIAANVVSPANDFSNLAPRRISFKMGGLITAVIGVVMMPWKLVERPDVYIFSWLIGYGALLGPIAGIMIADYYVVRKTQLHLADLYRRDGRYGTLNWATLVILGLAILPNVPGFLASVGVQGIGQGWREVFTYAWFVGFGIAFVLYSLYGLLCKSTRTTLTAAG